ncbi:MAG: transcription elongation factor GreA [Bacteroidota bacterium]|nr:transcription elongation factor GreA [Bacteroidota bacterium]
MSEINYFTKDGLDKQNEELRILKTKGRSDIAKQIQEAREKGDLSENAEYDAAKDAQGMLEAKIATLENTLANARVLSESSITTDKVMILSSVTVTNLSTKKQVKYKLVSENEANLKEGKISIKSPIAQALVGHAIGDEVEAHVPAGSLKFRIENISID